MIRIEKSNFNNGERAKIQLGRMDLMKLFTIEYCPECDSEAVIWSHGVSACNSCGSPLAPCSVCTAENEDYNCSNCPYYGLPRITMPLISEQDAEWLYRYL